MPFNISPRLLQAFLALEETRHFTRAAERCCVSQSALSGMIKRLEDALGSRLFDRNTRNVSLTPEGQLFAEAASRLMADFDSVFENLRDHVAKKRGHIGIAALPSLAAGWLPHLLAQYKQTYPGIHIELFDSNSDRCLDLLQEGKADVAITSPGNRIVEFDAEPLFADRFYLVCPKDHALARFKSIQLKQLEHQSFVQLRKGTSVRQLIDARLEAIGIRAEGLEVEQLATAAGLVAAGLGVAIVPELTLFQFQDKRLKVISIQEDNFERPLLIVKIKGKSLSVAANAFMGHLQKSSPTRSTCDSL